MTDEGGAKWDHRAKTVVKARGSQARTIGLTFVRDDSGIIPANPSSQVFLNRYPFTNPGVNTPDLFLIRYPTAVIKWGHGNIQAQAEIDFLRGVSLSLFGSSIEVSLRPGFLDGFDYTVDTMRMGAFIGPDSAGRRTVPTKTRIYEGAMTDDLRAWSVGTSGGTLIAAVEGSLIPNFAVNLQVYPILSTANDAALEPSPFRVAIFDYAGNILMTKDFPTGIQTEKLHLPGQAFRVAIRNLDAVKNVSGYQLVYDIGI